MTVITVKRVVRSKGSNREKLSDIGRNYFENEWKWQFAIEALLFAVMAIASAWPLFAAADALNDLLQRT